MSLKELKNIYGSKSEGKLVQYRQNIQKKLDEVLQNQDWQADNIIQHNDHEYAQSETLDCIIYYVTGCLFF